LEKSIEKELLERLQKGVYPTDIVNINMKEYERVSCASVMLASVLASVDSHSSHSNVCHYMTSTSCMT